MKKDGEGLTVGELINRLEGFPRDWRVVTPGMDESGPEDVETVRTILVEFHDELGWCQLGRHTRSDRGEPAVEINFDAGD